MELRNRKKLGTTEYLAQWWFDSGNDPQEQSGPQEFFDELEAAQEWAESQWPKLDHPDDGEWWVRIDKGTWTADEFEDDEYGTIYDATFEQDDTFYCTGWKGTSPRQPILWDIEEE